MSQLTHLRGQLTALKRRRQAVRLGVALLTVAIAVLGALVALFALDVLLTMSWQQRVVAMAVAIGVVGWATYKFALPWLGHNESELDMALLVEKHQKIDTSDLVAAIQFESPEAALWGSRQLETAVIDYVADFSRGWNVFDGFSTGQFWRRAAIVISTLALIGVGAVLLPGHFSTFFKRLGLSNEHYPSRTKIVRIEINGVAVEGEASSAKAAYGQAVKFTVIVDGDLPDNGRLETRTINSNITGRGVELVHADATDQGQAVYRGELPQLLDSIEYQVYLGDAWTEPARLEVIPLPVIEVQTAVTPPSYAVGGGAEPEQQTGARQLSVIEGSQVELEVLCNNKPLQSAELIVGENRYPLVRHSKYAPSRDVSDRPSPERWVSAKSEGGQSPLANISEPLSYQIQVVDADGLTLENPIEGTIRIKTDRRPTVTAVVRTVNCLPAAKPKIYYSAADDFGIGRVELQMEVLRKGQDNTQSSVVIRDGKQPILAARLPMGDTYQLQLEPLKLSKDDQVRLTLQVLDYRGTHEGKSTSSEPIVLNITDESGVLAASSETDERVARQIDAIQKLQTGGTK